MKHLLLECICLLFSVCGLAGEVTVQLFHDHENEDIDKRSLLVEPTVAYCDNTIYIYSSIPIENLQVTIKDDFNNIVYSNVTTIFPQRNVLELNDLQNGQYIIELYIGKKLLYGYFLVM